MKMFKYRLEYGLVRFFDIFFQVLPWAVALRLGIGLGLLFRVILQKRDRLILSNLKQSFPEKTDDELNAIALEVWRNLGRVVVEFIWLPRLARTMGPHVEWEGAEHMEKALADQKGVVLLSPHFTNWEMSGCFMSGRFKCMTVIARPVRNPFVDAWVQKKRLAGGIDVILHRDAVRASLKTLRAKRIIGILPDQNLYTGGEFVEFFGRPAATTTLPELLHQRTGAPVLLCYGLRTPRGFKMTIEPPIPNVTTQAVSSHIEAVIRRNPGNWFWIHNRWKRKQQ